MNTEQVKTFPKLTTDSHPNFWTSCIIY